MKLVKNQSLALKVRVSGAFKIVKAHFIGMEDGWIKAEGFFSGSIYTVKPENCIPYKSFFEIGKSYPFKGEFYTVLEKAPETVKLESSNGQKFSRRWFDLSFDWEDSHFIEFQQRRYSLNGAFSESIADLSEEERKSISVDILIQLKIFQDVNGQILIPKEQTQNIIEMLERLSN